MARLLAVSISGVNPGPVKSALLLEFLAQHFAGPQVVIVRRLQQKYRSMRLLYGAQEALLEFGHTLPGHGPGSKGNIRLDRQIRLRGQKGLDAAV